LARLSELDRVRAFYEASGYGAGVAPEDRVDIASDLSGLLGAVRLVREFETTILRGKRVAEAPRRRSLRRDSQTISRTGRVSS
jgi:hypothetical protein